MVNKNKAFRGFSLPLRPPSENPENARKSDEKTE
jgi:hypothetical protein